MKDLTAIKEKISNMKDSDKKNKILKDIDTKQKHKIVNKDGVRN